MGSSHWSQAYQFLQFSNSLLLWLQWDEIGWAAIQFSTQGAPDTDSNHLDFPSFTCMKYATALNVHPSAAEETCFALGLTTNKAWWRDRASPQMSRDLRNWHVANQEKVSFMRICGCWTQFGRLRLLSSACYVLVFFIGHVPEVDCWGDLRDCACPLVPSRFFRTNSHACVASHGHRENQAETSW